jgi:uncharacterized glyoxalase superfamily protein PhnB
MVNAEAGMVSIERMIPILVYDDIAVAHDFLVDAFGFESGGLQRTPDGVVVHGEVRAGEIVIWLHRVAPEHELLAPSSLPGAAGGLVIHVGDIQAHYLRACSRGARIDSEPADQPYGQREYGARDPGGHRWWFAKPLASA